jgi:polysaccharide deacetylase family protein (PEP-CTERM system associated)
MLNALTIDVEDYFHAHALEHTFPRTSWNDISSRVACSTRRVLRILRENDAKATFFVLGWVAQRHPEIVREIAADGHELATHGFAHESVYEMDPESFRQDVRKSMEAIAAACPDVQIRGYRAPSFSINHQTPWAFDILTELNLAYDSSISPATFHDRYGTPSACRFAHMITPKMLEIPLSSIRMMGCNWQIAGGGYFRLFPLPITSWAIEKINREGHPAVVYLHPWEFDPDQPRAQTAPLFSRFRHYVNLRKTEERLRKLLRRFAFGPINQVFRERLCFIYAETACPRTETGSPGHYASGKLAPT